jgi:hypothetical protein
VVLHRVGSAPKIIWVAARPPVPPFSGPTSKTLCGIDALSTFTDIHLVTFTHKDSQVETRHKLQQYWRDRPYSIKFHLIEYGRKANMIEAALAKRFQFGTMIENSALSFVLDELDWNNPDHLLVLDDIVLSPFVVRNGSNAILSPHDCISKMSYSHFRLSPVGLAAAKYYSQHLIAQRYEKALFHLALLVHVVTERDRVWLQQINPRARYHVVPNSDLLNPGFTKAESYGWDVMIWGDLGIGSIAQGAKEFVRLIAQDKAWLHRNKVILIGRVSRSEAERIIGDHLLASIEYSSYLENDAGKLRQAKITVVPDLGGAGTKNRSVNLLSSGMCLACLYPQMEGVDKAYDRGAINAPDTEKLVALVKAALLDDSYISIAEMGEAIFRREYSLESLRQSWYEMIERALTIRGRY